MARTIAEILAYNRAYSPELNPNLFNEDSQMIPEVRDKILEIVDAFLDYTQIKDDINVSDVRLVGSNASYNYNENSDLDVHIVVDLSKISKPETIAQLYFGEVKHAFKESYDIKIKGIDVELYVEDINASAVTNGIYSVSQDKWIKEPTPMEDPSEEDIAKAEEIESDIIDKINNASPGELDNIIDQLYVMRKDGLATEGETSPANLAFKSLRNKGVIDRAKDKLRAEVSKELSLESKKMRESRRLLEDIEDIYYVDEVKDLINMIKSKPVKKGVEYVIFTRKDGYDFYMLWSYNKGTKLPVVMVDKDGETIFKKSGNDGDELIKQAIQKLSSVKESRRIREMSRRPNKYWVYTDTYSMLKRDESKRAHFLSDSDNTSAYGPDDLVFKLKALKDMNIKVKNIYQEYSDSTSKDVTDKYRRYLL